MALLALGEPTDGDPRQHLRTCRACAGSLEELTGVVGVGRSLATEDREPAAPPASVWAGIAAELGLDQDRPAPDPFHPDEAPPAPRTVPRAYRTRYARSARYPHRARVRSPLLGLAAAAALVVVVGLVGALLLRSGGDDPAQAEADLVAFDAGPAGASGSAALVEVGDGASALEVEVAGLPERDDAYYELWLLDEAGGGLVSLGPVPEGGAVVTLPDDLDRNVFRTVDVSAEPFDGDPTHSTDSVLRGTLESA